MKILLFDDHRIFGESLSKLLEDWDEISICRYVSNETEFWNILSVDEWDIVLLDVNLREQSKSSGIDLIETIYSKKQKIKVVMLRTYIFVPTKFPYSSAAFVIFLPLFLVRLFFHHIKKYICHKNLQPNLVNV